MNRTTSTPTRRRSALIGATTAFALVPGLVAAAEPPPGLPPNIGLKVSRELQRQGSLPNPPGEGALMDNSGATKCMYADPEPLTYSTREIILRADLTAQQATKQVNRSIGRNGAGHATGARVIVLPQVPAAPGDREAADDGLDPVIVVAVEPDLDGHWVDVEVEIVNVARKLRARGITASPNYFMSPTDEGPSGVWPNGYPRITEVETTPRLSTIGAGVKVFVYDVGLAPADYHDGPDNVVELGDSWDDTELLDEVDPEFKVDQYYGGHTVAISDVIATLAPGAEVKAVRVTNSSGLVTDATATTRMVSTLKQAGANAPQVIINSFGSPACDVSSDPDDGEMVPLGLEAISDVIHRREQSVLVAAAGNRSTDRQFYPGAFDFGAVIGVGALDVMVEGDDPEDGMWVSASRTGELAEFSNFGSWVDAWAPGTGLPVRHIKDLWFLLESEPMMTGRAFVDGTSYAAPYVAALIADELGRHLGTPPLDIWLAIERAGVPCDESVGGTAVALTTMGDKAVTPPTEIGVCAPR